jgi:integrase
MRGDGRIFWRGTKAWIAYYAPGPDGRSHEQREPAGSTEAEARKLLRQRLREVGAHTMGLRPFMGPRQERVTVEELLQNYERDCGVRGVKGLKSLHSHLKHVRAFFGLDRALAVTRERLLGYVRTRQKATSRRGTLTSNTTINRELEGLQAAFTLAVDSGTLAIAPKFPSLPEHNARQGFFEHGDFYAVLAQLRDPGVVDFLEWFYLTGMRPEETRSLTWECFDRETWTLRLHARDAKIGQARMLALEGPLRATVERRLKDRRFGCDFVFHRNGKRVGEFRKSWKSACRRAGVSGKIPYDLRRTAVRNTVRAGVPERVAMAISGHKTRAVFDRYNITSEKDLREAVTKTAEYLSALPKDQPSKVVALKKG